MHNRNGNFRKMMSRILLAAALMILTFPAALRAQQKPDQKTRFLFLLDCSGSMWGDLGSKQKMMVAKQLLGRLVDSLNNVQGVEMALRAYGHMSSHARRDCRDTRLEVSFNVFNAKEIKDKLGELNPSGTTPIAFSLQQAAGDFPDRHANNYIILITDGLEECGGDPCEISQTLQAKGVILRPFIIGLGMNEDYGKQFGCVGKFFPAETEGELRTVLSTVVSQALENTSVSVNLNDVNGNPTETDVNMTFYNAKTGVPVSNYYHTMGATNKPDSFSMESSIRYNLTVHTTPPVLKKDIEVKMARHTTINVNAAQGSIKMNVKRADDQVPLKCLVRQAGQKEVIYVQDFNTQHKYLVGTYDLEVLCLPRMKIDKVKVDQSKAAQVSIPQPGILELQFPVDAIASLFVMRNAEQEWVADLRGYAANPGSVYYLQPGRYKVVYRKAKAVETTDTREFDITITSGGRLSLNLE